MIASCEDQRNRISWSDRDMFVDFSRSKSAELAFAVCVFFNFGRVVSMSSNKFQSQQIQDVWETNKTKLFLRKKPTISPKKKKKIGGKTIKKKKQKKKKTKYKLSSMYAQCASWLSFQKYSELSIGLINLTSIPPLGYPTYGMESNNWRPTLQQALSVMEDRLIECELETFFVVVTRVASGKVSLMGWKNVEHIHYVKENEDIVMELLVRDDGEEEEEQQEKYGRPETNEIDENLNILSAAFQ